MIITNIDNSHSSEMSSSSLMQQQQNMNELARGADKGELSSSMGSYGTEYAYCQPPPHHLIPQCSAATSYQNPFYNSPGYSHGYQRGMFNNHEMDQTSPPRTSSPSRSVFDRSRYQEWTAMINHPHPNSVHQNFQSQVCFSWSYSNLGQIRPTRFTRIADHPSFLFTLNLQFRYFHYKSWYIVDYFKFLATAGKWVPNMLASIPCYDELLSLNSSCDWSPLLRIVWRWESRPC